VIDDATVEGVCVDMSGQATFEAGVLLWEMAFRRHAMDGYPRVCPLRGIVMPHDVADTCVLSAEEQRGAADAGYPVAQFTQLVREMVAMDATRRPSLTDARRRLETMLNPATVGQGLPDLLGGGFE
jgi:hypothetical protein